MYKVNIAGKHYEFSKIDLKIDELKEWLDTYEASLKSMAGNHY